MDVYNFIQISGCSFGRGAVAGNLAADDQELLRCLTAAVQENQADVILVPGGFFDREQAEPEAINAVFAALALLPPVIVAPGRQDYWSPLSPYSSLARERRGLEPLPSNLFVFTPEWQTIFPCPGRDLAVSGRGVKGRGGNREINDENPGASADNDPPRRSDGAAVSVLLMPEPEKADAAEILRRRFTYTAYSASGTADAEKESDKDFSEIMDGLGNIRGGIGIGRGIAAGFLDENGAHDLRCSLVI